MNLSNDVDKFLKKDLHSQKPHFIFTSSYKFLLQFP